MAAIGAFTLGFEGDAPGAWLDHDVYFDRAEAEADAQLIETSVIIDSDGTDISADVLTVARVRRLDEIDEEFGQERTAEILTVFRERLSTLTRQP